MLPPLPKGRGIRIDILMKKVLFGLVLLFIGCIGWDMGHIAYYSHWLTHTCLTTPYTPQKGEELSPIFTQAFTFLDQGSTSEVFVSQDRKTVLKVFLDKNYSSRSRKHIPFLGKLSAKRKELKMKKARYKATINSYALLPKETGMLYYHFSPTDTFHQSITLIDKEGNKRTLDLDRENYLIQRKAIVAWDYIHRHVTQGDLEEARLAIKKLLTFTKLLYDQGIVLIDLQFASNFGFIDGEPTRIDTEHLTFKRSWKTSYQTHLSEQLADFRVWIEECCPSSLLAYFDEKVAAIFQDK
ncbi:hypothetical protein [Candidatus Neptunochlamydia vexilliferae]|uniref:Uncharacterized protein n=1 Tax=Candidatus Neptunichlamydia vexilliferae TaxID=1651774 RepID=A0ABS0B1I9_9BACT|nr:hypothetical protein [Candidatus Neptunochlamydia vexilliferae]MBF5060273.1 hypothetical protein [Candidatus Neptunochlamydia vexilliferae]